MQPKARPQVESDTGLAGRRVALARAAEEAHTPAGALTERGAELVYYPCLEILPPDNLAEFDREVKRLAAGHYDWLILTTASAVIVLAERLEHLKLSPRKLQDVKVALYGANTRLAAQDLLHIDLTKLPEAASHAELVRLLRITPGSQVFLPLAAGHRADWVDLLRAQGAQVTPMAAYRAHMGHGGDELPAMLWSGAVDAIAFTSENNVRYFAKRLQYEGGTLAMLDHVCIACIEPQTAAAARALGLRVTVVPPEHTPEGLATELADYFSRAGR